LQQSEGAGAVTAIHDYIRSLERYVESRGMRVLRTALPEAVHGRVFCDLIALRVGLEPQQEFCTLVHELAHSLAHRGARARMNCSNCTIFEYEAEAVEALVMSRLGLSPAEDAAPGLAAGAPTDGLLSASVARVIWASDRICTALGLAD
jgi:hypothetical protein